MNGAGYQFLIEKYELEVPQPLVRCFFTESSTKSERTSYGQTEIFFPKWRHAFDDTWQNHLNFALKYEGVNLEILKAFFAKVPEAEFVKEVQSKPTGKYCRRIWFLYEFLTGKTLPLKDVTTGVFVELLDGDVQFALPSQNSVKQKRQRILNNLPGNRYFCPLVRLTPSVKEFRAEVLKEQSDQLLSQYSPELLYRAVQYLYIRETKSSFAIERETPSQKRMDDFVNLLKEVEKDCLSQESLCKVQEKIVDQRYAQNTWRNDQVYVGETLSPTEERVHYIAPRPEDISELMDAYLQFAQNLCNADCDAVVSAAIIGFAFVFLHPFDDGNGRTHRYLLHHVLARKTFTPPKIIFPVSAVLLKNSGTYDSMLESVSSRIMPKIDYSINETGEVKVTNDTADFYRFMDFTLIVEELQKVIQTTIQTEWKAELSYLQRYDSIRKQMCEIVDMPDKKANQFIMFVQQNGGKLSKSRRDFFSELTDDEIEKMEEVIRG